MLLIILSSSNKKAITSSKNIFSLAQKTLQQNPSLSKVVIMEHPPRFDPPHIDPTAVKANLARLANATLGQLWLNSPLKDKIFIGHHSLESTGNSAAHFERYQNSRTGRYDGVHLYGETGRRDYTNSVKSIFLMAFEQKSTQTSPQSGSAQSDKHGNCPKAKYQEKKKYHPYVQTQNRFDIFNKNFSKNY